MRRRCNFVYQIGEWIYKNPTKLPEVKTIRCLWLVSRHAQDNSVRQLLIHVCCTSYTLCIVVDCRLLNVQQCGMPIQGENKFNIIKKNLKTWSGNWTTRGTTIDYDWKRIEILGRVEVNRIVWQIQCTYSFSKSTEEVFYMQRAW